jgi:hypothetical protein
MQNIINSRPEAVYVIETQPLPLSPEQRITIDEAKSRIDVIESRRRAAAPDEIINHARNISAAYAEGTATLTQALALRAMAQTDDEPARAASESLRAACDRARQSVLRLIAPIIIADLAHRNEQVRQRCNEIEMREQADAESFGIPYEPSEMLRRLQETYRMRVERLRELRDQGALPSRAELREI